MTILNATLQKFGYPGSVICDFDHWVVLIRPVQVTLASAVIAAKSDVVSFGALRPDQMAELSSVIQRFESVVAGGFGAEKFNYLGLMMVDPNPHFHAIPRYRAPVSYLDKWFTDERFPKPPALDVVNECSIEMLHTLRKDLALRFKS